MSKALLLHGALVACGTHDKKRTYRKPKWPRSKCPVCHLVAMADQLETSLYQDDIEAILKFAGKPKITEYEETSDADVHV